MQYWYRVKRTIALHSSRGMKKGQMFKSLKTIENMSPDERKAYFDEMHEICKNRKVKRYTNPFILNILALFIPLTRNFEIEINGEENLMDVGNAIYLCNHSNTHDAFVVREVFHKLKKEVAPLVAWDGLNCFSRLLWKLFDCVLIKRDDAASKKDGVLDLCSKVINGKNGFIFGEATWNMHPTRPMQNLHAGATEVALITEKPIVPVIFEYVEVDRICKKESELYKKCLVSFGKPIAISAEKGIFEQTNHLQSIMESLRKAIWEREGVKKDNMSDVDIERYINHTYLKKFNAFGFKYNTRLESQFLLRNVQPIENEYCLNSGGMFAAGVIEKEKKSDKMVKKVKNTEEKELTVSRIALFFSIFAIAVSLWSQFYFIRGNPLAKANAGWIKSQLFLADHYYEIGDYDESIYWNKIAAAHKGIEGAYAKNNLAVLYVKKGVEFNDDQYIRERIFSLFEDSYNSGVIEAGQNLYAYLNQSPTMVEIDDVKKAEIAESIEEYLINNGAFEGKLSNLDADWEYMGTKTGNSVPEDTVDYRFVTISSDYVPEADNDSMRWIFSYKVYKKTQKSERFEYKYVPYK